MLTAPAGPIAQWETPGSNEPCFIYAGLNTIMHISQVRRASADDFYPSDERPRLTWVAHAARSLSDPQQIRFCMTHSLSHDCRFDRTDVVHVVGAVFHHMSWQPACLNALEVAKSFTRFHLQWAFAAARGHLLIKSVLDTALPRVVAQDVSFVNVHFVHDITGPGVWTIGLFDNLYAGSNIPATLTLEQARALKDKEWRQQGVCILTRADMYQRLAYQNGSQGNGFLEGPGWSSWTQERDALHAAATSPPHGTEVRWWGSKRAWSRVHPRTSWWRITNVKICGDAAMHPCGQQLLQASQTMHSLIVATASCLCS